MSCTENTYFRFGKGSNYNLDGAIEFDESNSLLTIYKGLNEEEEIISCTVDISSAKLLTFKKVSGKLQVKVQSTTFNNSPFKLDIHLKTDVNPDNSLTFGKLTSSCTLTVGNHSADIGLADEFHLLGIGSDDIRNRTNVDSPMLFLLEPNEGDEIKIRLRYNNSIANPTLFVEYGAS